MADRLFISVVVAGVVFLAGAIVTLLISVYDTLPWITWLAILAVGAGFLAFLIDWATDRRQP